ncbi:MAG: DUF3786 domain-containing protein [Proteobacteria bacterium]|nr:DUF3786 domain-containing protein [Pseudomonadota bacterium]
MKDTSALDGQRVIYEDLVRLLARADVVTSAKNLDLELNETGEAEVSFFGATYLVSKEGVRRPDGQRFPDAFGSVLIHYILNASLSRPTGRFVTFQELAGPLFKHGSYSASALELPVVRRFQGRVPELVALAATVRGRQEGVGGFRSVSLIFDLLPHIPIQLIFYDRDDEFPARATLLFDHNATQMIDFEVLAVLVTIFVRNLTKAGFGEMA